MNSWDKTVLRSWRLISALTSTGTSQETLSIILVKGEEGQAAKLSLSKTIILYHSSTAICPKSIQKGSTLHMAWKTESGMAWVWWTFNNLTRIPANLPRKLEKLANHQKRIPTSISSLVVSLTRKAMQSCLGLISPSGISSSQLRAITNQSITLIFHIKFGATNGSPLPRTDCSISTRRKLKCRRGFSSM